MGIQVTIANKRATVAGAPVIVCGNSGYTVNFTFDKDWDGMKYKTARFVYVQAGEVKYQDVVFAGTTAEVPVIANTKEVRVGVFAGELRTSTPAVIPCELSIRCGTGAPDDPTPSQYDQIMTLLWSSGTGTTFITDETLQLDDGELRVNVTEDVSEGNNLPVTAGAVYKGISDIGRINTVTGTSATITDAIAGRVISCVGDSDITVSGYNICSIKELNGVGYTSAIFGTKLPAGTYTLTAKGTTNNPTDTSIKVSIGGFLKSLTCDGKRRSATFSISRDVSARLEFWASNSTSPVTEYSATLSDIVITADSTAREYEPYFEPVTYSADKLNEIELTEYTNIITSYSEFTLKYVCETAYTKSLLSSIDVGEKMYVAPEDFGAYGNGLADDTHAINECIAYGIANSIPIRCYGKYKTTEPINIIGDYVDLHIYKIDYLGNDNAVVFEGSNSLVTIHSIRSKGNGLRVMSETANVYYNTFTINEIISKKNGVHIYAKKNAYQNKLNFNLIKASGEYSCILFELAENPDPGYLNEWEINGGLVTGGMWGVRGCLNISDRINIHAEGLGSNGNGGGIYAENGNIPRIYYCRNAELVQTATFLKVSGVFTKPQAAEICRTTAMPLQAIDITEVTLDRAEELRSDNIQMLTNLEIQTELFSNTLLTKNLIIWGNRFQFPPVRYIRFDVDADIDMTPQYYNAVIPQCFVAKADAAIHLHPTYAANCLSTFEIVQEEGHKLTVYDFVGNVIFDGSQYEDGRYRLTAYVAKNEPLWYDMHNQLWEIVKM